MIALAAATLLVSAGGMTAARPRTRRRPAASSTSAAPATRSERPPATCRPAVNRPLRPRAGRSRTTTTRQPSRASTRPGPPRTSPSTSQNPREGHAGHEDGSMPACATSSIADLSLSGPVQPRRHHEVRRPRPPPPWAPSPSETRADLNAAGAIPAAFFVRSPIAPPGTTAPPARPLKIAPSARKLPAERVATPETPCPMVQPSAATPPVPIRKVRQHVALHLARVVGASQRNSPCRRAARKAAAEHARRRAPTGKSDREPLDSAASPKSRPSGQGRRRRKVEALDARVSIENGRPQPPAYGEAQHDEEPDPRDQGSAAGSRAGRSPSGGMGRALRRRETHPRRRAAQAADRRTPPSRPRSYGQAVLAPRGAIEAAKRIGRSAKCARRP